MKEYVTYITRYSGTKLPQWYIGSTYRDNIGKGYNGSVCSKKWKTIYKDEQQTNKHLFKTRILSYHNEREEATSEELRLQRMHNVVNNDKYFNESYASKSGMFGRDVRAELHPLYGTKWSQERRRKTKETKKLNNSNEIGGKKCSQTKQSKEWKNTIGRATIEKQLETKSTPEYKRRLKEMQSHINKKHKETLSSKKWLENNTGEFHWHSKTYTMYDANGNIFYEGKTNVSTISKMFGISSNVLYSTLKNKTKMYVNSGTSQINQMKKNGNYNSFITFKGYRLVCNDVK